jgi:hypothetical protein
LIKELESQSSSCKIDKNGSNIIEEPNTESLKRKTVNELKEIAKSLGIKLKSKLKKEDLINAIKDIK